ncbi:MAG: ankyrin repeat domain-containing protein [Planctomycetaceae bacterium]|jgi:ankyrin repeat protein|nr:ankyrin repeat domain-containing protein [Planctomycetaceae bacterium]
MSHFKEIAEGDLQTAEQWLDADSSYIHNRDKNDATPIHAAATNPDVNVIKLLVNRGADIHLKNTQGATPLYWAAKNPNLEVVKFLVEQGADIQANDNGGETPLDYAKHYEIKKILQSAERKNESQ